MKTIVAFICAFGVMFVGYTQNSKSGRKIPSVELKDMDGKVVNTSELAKEGHIIISFWATWCAPCKRELNAIHEYYPDWQDEFGVKLVAVSIDDEKTKHSVPIYVNGRGWEYQILMDTNSDFRRLMGVNNVPHTFIVNDAGDIVYSHNSYSPGDEDLLYEELKRLTETK